MGTGEGKVAAVPRNAGNEHVKGEPENLCFDWLRVLTLWNFTGNDHQPFSETSF